MGKRIITKFIRKIYFKRLIPNLIFLSFCIFIWINYPFYNILYPDAVNTLTDITKKIDSEESFIQISLPTLYYSGYDCLKNNNKYGGYYYTFIDDKCVFILLSDELCSSRAQVIDNLKIKAKILRDIDNLEFLTQNFANDINWSVSDMQLTTTAFILSEVDYNATHTHILLFMLSLFSLYTLFYTFTYLYLLYAPHFSPMCKNLGSSYSKRKNSLAKADYELKERRFLYAEDMTLTSHFFIELTKNKIEVVPINSILWAYKHSNVFPHSKYFSKITYTLCLHTANKTIRCYQKEKDSVDQILYYLDNNHENILLGYSLENKEYYKSFSIHSKK